MKTKKQTVKFKVGDIVIDPISRREPYGHVISIECEDEYNIKWWDVSNNSTREEVYNARTSGNHAIRKGTKQDIKRIKLELIK